MRHIGTRPPPVTDLAGAVRRVVAPRRSRRTRLDWSAVGAGLAIASAIQFALALFGRAISAGATVAGEGTARDVASMLGGSAVLAISLYVGGSATGRISGARTGDRGMLHGVVLWALSTLLVAWLVTSDGRHAAVVALGIPGAIEFPATWDAPAGVWLALLGLGVGVAAAIGGVRGWLRPPARSGAARGERDGSHRSPRGPAAPTRPHDGTPTDPDDVTDSAARRTRATTPGERSP